MKGERLFHGRAVLFAILVLNLRQSSKGSAVIGQTGGIRAEFSDHLGLFFRGKGLEISSHPG
jgi:hypothetical protein